MRVLTPNHVRKQVHKPPGLDLHANGIKRLFQNPDRSFYTSPLPRLLPRQIHRYAVILRVVNIPPATYLNSVVVQVPDLLHPSAYLAIQVPPNARALATAVKIFFRIALQVHHARLAQAPHVNFPLTLFTNNHSDVGKTHRLERVAPAIRTATVFVLKQLG